MPRGVTEHNNLAVLNPLLAAEWDYTKNEVSPDKYRACGKDKVWWTCSLGHSWMAAIYARHKGTGCPVCTGRFPSDTNNFAVVCPHLLEEWDYDKNKPPESYTPNSPKKVHWKCSTCGFNWNSSLHTRTKGVGCPYCAGQIVRPDHNLAVCFPELLQEWDYQRNSKPPEQYLPKVRHVVWWKCPKCDHSWQSSIVLRTRGFKKCSKCSKYDYGFDKTKPGYLYIQAINFNWENEIIKFGITNRNPNSRMREQQRESGGNHLFIATQYFEHGAHALEIEQAIKKEFKDVLNASVRKFGGSTETMPKKYLNKLFGFIGRMPWPSE